MRTTMRIVLRITSVAVLALMVHGAEAAVYYVAREHPKAADTNPGTEDQPWATLTHAGKTVKSRDVVWVKAGTYRETLTTESDNVRFQAYGDDAVVIAPPKGLVIAPASWREVPDRECVYQCKADTKGKKLRVDGLALQFEKIQGVKVKISFGSGEATRTPVDRHFEDTDARRWTTTVCPRCRRLHRWDDQARTVPWSVSAAQGVSIPALDGRCARPDRQARRCDKGTRGGQQRPSGGPVGQRHDGRPGVSSSGRPDVPDRYPDVADPLAS